MQPGSIELLTPSEVEEAIQDAPCRTEMFAVWIAPGGRRRHRDGDLPAVIYYNGTQAWYQLGKLHRDNGLPAEIHPDGKMTWWEHGKFTGDQDDPPPDAQTFFLPQPGQQTKSANKK